MSKTMPLSSSGISAAVAADVVVSDPLFQKRIRFHKERNPYIPMSISNSKNFELETLNPSSMNQKSTVLDKATAQELGKKAASELESGLGFRITLKRIGAGLENLGNTCYLNSVLQCLTYTEPFAAYCHSKEHTSSCRTAGFCAMCALQNHVTNALQASGKIVSPHHIVKNLRCISRNFRTWRQEDAHEYMVNLLESMHKNCLPSGVPTESPSAYEKSLVHKIFGGRLRSQVKCLQCSYCSNKFDPFLDLSLEIYRTDSLIKALKHFTAVEQLDGGAKQYQCQRCQEKVRAYKQLTIHNAPYVLTIHLKRFGPTNEKIDKRVSFETTLNLKPFVSDQQEGDLKYTLYGVLVHNGYNTHSGHYYCYVRTSTGVWHRLDDNKVRSVNENVVLSEKAYMLFYVRDRSSVNKRSADVLGDNIMTNFPKRQAIIQPVTNGTLQIADKKPIMNGTLQIADKKPIMNGTLQIADKKPITNGPLQNADKKPIITENKPTDTSRIPLSITINSKKGSDLPKENTVIENTVHDLTQVTGLKPNIQVASNGLQQTSSHINNEKKDIGEVTSSNTQCEKDKESPIKADGAMNNTSWKTPAAETVLGKKSTTKKKDKVGKKPKSNKICKSRQYFGRKQLFFASLRKKHKKCKKQRLAFKHTVKDKTDEQVVPTSDSGNMVDVVSACEPPKPYCFSINKGIKIMEAKNTKSHEGDDRKIGCFSINQGIEIEEAKNTKSHEGDDRKIGCFSINNGMKIVEAKNTKSQEGDDRKISCYSINKGIKFEEAKNTKSHEGGDRKISSSSNNGAVLVAINQSMVKSSIVADLDSVSLLKSLKQTTVPHWDDVELPPVPVNYGDDERRNKKRPRYDDWDEALDQGKRKKVKKSKNLQNGEYNPFQEAANEQLHLKVKPRNFGNKPMRI